MKTTQTESVFGILTILQVEKHWTKVRTSVIAYSLIFYAYSRKQTHPHHEATILHEVTALKVSLPI